MFNSRKMEHKINHIHKRILKLVYQDSHDVTFQENCWLKTKQLVFTNFHFVEIPYNLRSDYTLERKGDHTIYYGTENLSSHSPKLWNLLLNSINSSASLKEFKTKINTWAFDCCPCRICKKYVGRVGFI